MRKMNLVKKCGWFLGCFLAVTMTTACSDDENKIDDFIPGEGFTETMTVLPAKGSQVMKFTANDTWSAKSSQTWLKLDGQAQSSGKMGAAEMYVSYEVNEEPADRTADITLSVGSTIKTIKVTQKAAGRVISFDGVAGDTLKLQKDFTTGDAAILANVTWEFVADSLSVADKEWIEVTPQDGKVAIKILNQDGSARCARLVFRDKNFTSYTKVLFVAVEGWGENYLEWSLSKVEFPKEGDDTTKLSVTNVADVKPVALSADKDGNVEATEVDWIHFAQTPAAKSILKKQTWNVKIDESAIFKNRYACVFVVPVDMALADIVAKKDELGGVKITQFAVVPTATMLFFQRRKTDPERPWENVPDAGETSITWRMSFGMTGMDSGPFYYSDPQAKSYNLSIKFESNCKTSNMRVVASDKNGEIAYKDGEMIISDNPALTNFVAMDDFTWNFWPVPSASMSAATTFLVWDLLDEEGGVVGHYSYKLIYEGLIM